MSSSGNIGRLLGTINGQPIILKDDLGMNTITGFGSDILQQAIDEVPSPETLTSDVSCMSNIVLDPDQNVSLLNNERNEFIAVLSNDTISGETSSIRLTLEQAAQLGIHFTVDTSEHGLISDDVTKEIIDNSTNESQFTSEKSEECVEPSDTICMNSEVISNLTENVMLDKNSERSFLENFEHESSHGQQLTLIPHIINGAVAYTLQLTDESLSGLSNNDLFRLNEPTVLNPTSESVDSDLNNLSGSSELPFINSPVDLINNKELVDSNTVNDSSNPQQTFGIVCNSENVTFLNLADAIPVGTNISNIVSHINNMANQSSNSNQQPKLSSLLRRSNETLKQQNVLNQDGESLLKFRNFSLLKNGVNNHSQLSKNSTPGKTIEKVTFNNQVTTITAKSIINDNSNSSSDVFINQGERNGCLGSENTSTQSDLKNDATNKTMGNLLKSDSTSLDACRNDDTHSDNRQTPKVITPSLGNFPREVSFALSHIPIKTDSKKPLGSNENPIQLVQQGTTFHSMQALTDDHISKIKPILQGNFDPKIPSKNVMYDPASNTRIIYRIISPAEVSLRKQDDSPKRRGRPKKNRADQTEDLADGAPQPKKVFPRTRSGRLSRPPKHMVRDYKHLRRAEIDDSDGAYSDYQSEQEDLANPPESAPVELLPGLVAKRKSHKRNISAGNLCPTCGKIYLGHVRMKRHFDKYPDHGSIEYLNNLRNSNPDSEGENRADSGNGLWKKNGKRRGKGKYHFSSVDKRTRLKEALSWCSEEDVAEVAGPAVASVLSLWQLLLLRVDAVRVDTGSRVAALYSEMCQLLHKLRTVAHKLFRPVDHPTPTTKPPTTKPATVQVEDDLMTGVLDLPHGVYLASDEDLAEPPAAVVHNNTSPAPETQSVQDKLEDCAEDPKTKMDMDEEPQSFLLSSEEMICDSDERGLVNVDEIVSERLQNFTGSQASSVDELMNGLNELEHRTKLETDDLMDGFSIVSRRTHVSASTEDLMKSLEHSWPGLNHADASTALDRDTFDRVTNVDGLGFEVLS